MDSLQLVVTVLTVATFPLVGVIWAMLNARHEELKKQVAKMEAAAKTIEVDFEAKLDKVNDERKKNIDTLFDKIDGLSKSVTVSIKEMGDKVADLDKTVAIIVDRGDSERKST